MPWTTPDVRVELALDSGDGVFDDAIFDDAIFDTAGVWTDVNEHLTGDPIILEYGIRSSRPEDRVASTGTLVFSLRNDLATGALGYYSPYSAARRTGFGFGIGVRFSTYDPTAAEWRYWKGRLRVIDAVPGPLGERVSRCVAVDWMDEAARATTAVALQSSQRADQAFSALVACVPTAPAATDVDTSVDTYVYAFDNIWQGVKVLSAMADLARSEMGWIGVRRDTSAGQTVFFWNRQHLVLHSTLRATLDGTMHGLSVTSDASAALNHFRVSAHPREVQAGIVIAALDASTSDPIGPGDTQTIWLDYTDPTQRSVRIGAKNQITPAASTDYEYNAAADGSGADLTSTMTVAATWFASSVKYTITNAGTSTAYRRKLQARGDGIFALAQTMVETSDATSVAAYGDNVVDLDLTYQSDPGFATLVAQYLGQLYTTPTASVSSVTFCGNPSTTRLTAALAGDIGDKVELAEAVTGLTTATDFYITAVRLEFSERNRVDCTWRLAPFGRSQYWLWGVAGASEYGVTTYYGF